MKSITLSKKNIEKIRKIFVSSVVLVFVFTGGLFLGKKNVNVTLKGSPTVTISRDLPSNRQDLDFSLFWRVWDTLETSYFDQDKLVASDMVYGAIRGMVAAVGDPYTVFLPPSDNRVVQEDLQGNFEGVGIQIGFKGSQLAVIAPLPESPASGAGIQAGDLIIGIKDEKKDLEIGTVGITLPEAVQAIRGPAGSTVTLSLLRDGEDQAIITDIKRAKIDVPSVILSFVGDDEEIAHIQLLRFGGSTNSEWNKAVSEIIRKPEVKGIVLDLRNNPGGFLQGSVDIAAEFFETQTIVTIQESSDGSTENFTTTRLGKLRNRPLVVLVNGGSASASEILAGALRDNLQTILIGETTFGKGTIQEPQQINGGAALHITTAKWLTPSGIWVNDGDGGLAPDVEIEDDPETPEDEQMQEAIKRVSN